jgi:hypothetical protein
MIYVASILMQRSSGGPGVLDLAQQIARNLGGAPELKAKLWANVAKCLGRDFDSALDTRFDKEFSDATFRVVRANDVPCIVLPLPVDVLDARLKVSLDIVAGKKPVAWHAVQMSLRMKK